MVVASVWTETYYQQRVDDRLLGRVLGVTENVSAAGILLGVVIASVVGGPFGSVTVLMLGTGVLLVTGTLAFFSLRDARTVLPSSAGVEHQAAAYGE